MSSASHSSPDHMHPFGGTQLCPRCSKAVYAAEQIMGPGLKLYHKPCLACLKCNKRLDSYTLLEHNQEPYCKSCYTRNFSARDLRQANLPVRETSRSPVLSSPPNAIIEKSSNCLPSHATTFATDILPEPASEHKDEETVDHVAPPIETSPPYVQQNSSGPSLPSRPTHHSSSSTGTLSNLRSFQSQNKDLLNTSFSTFGRNNNSTTTAALSLLEKEGINSLVQTSTGTRYGAALGGPMAGMLKSSSPARKWTAAETPTCPKCTQRVYFAEQVKAVGKTWHKNCFRCNECNTLLDSNRLRDHEGTPLCVRCYNKLHGPQGSGYALLGKAGG